MDLMSRGGSSRENFFFNRPGENTNVAPVVYKSEPAKSSAGWNQAGFFEALGDPRNQQGSPRRNAEQEYLLQGMVKGAMTGASRIATRFHCGISVRPTGVLAHMGIESGNPTKAQEFKNKTSKEPDLFLCDELEWRDIGAVVHYDPRAGWTSKDASRPLVGAKPLPEPTELDWEIKRKYILAIRIPDLKAKKLEGRMQFWPKSEADWKRLKDLFMDRAKEYAEEDPEYRAGGHYAPYTHLEGPYVRLKDRADTNMVGDHDLFGFTRGETGILIPDDTLTAVQVALQESLDFQAQHGGIWNWQPREEFHKDIKKKIMGAHSQPHGDPLLHFLPGGAVRAVFYMPLTETLESVWDHPGATRWLSQTSSGKLL
jgi:hypothetical protein